MARTKKNNEQREMEQAKAFELRLKGWNYSAIGASLGVSQQTAHKWIKDRIAETRETTQEQVEDIVAIELARLDLVIVRAEERLQESYCPKASEILLKVAARRSSLLGLDEARNLSLSIVQDITDGELKSRVSDIISRQEEAQAGTTH
tara:strand:+ start:114 stop:557 length:444 start_codon:yes stop_codon:yes gene_type:complete